MAVTLSTETPFLQNFAEQLLANHLDELADIQVILPTRRACLYTKYYLADALFKHQTQYKKKAVIAPQIRSIEDFIADVSAFEISDYLYLIVELFNTYKQFDHDEEHNLEKFTPLGSVILKDFDMIDRHLVNGLKLYDYLHDVKEIEERWRKDYSEDEWAKFDIQKELEKVKHYTQFWKYLSATYKAFREKLAASGRAYTGMAFRWVAENIKAILEKNSFKHIYFIGFNQFLPAEMYLVQQLEKEQMATVLWDMDSFFVEAPYLTPMNPKQPNPQFLHEAGEYFRRYLQQRYEVPHPKQLRPYHYETQTIQQIAQVPKNIHFIGTNNKVTQAKVAGDLVAKILKDLPEKEHSNFQQSINRIGIILPDESMVMPMLYSLPTHNSFMAATGFSVKALFNVTMGLTINKTPLYDLLLSLFKLQENLRENDEEELTIYHKDIFKILKHPFIYHSIYKSLIDTFLNEIQQQNRVYVPLKEIITLDLQYTNEQEEVISLKQLTQVFFTDWQDSVPQAAQQLYDIIPVLYKLLDKEKNLLEFEYLLELYKLLKRMDTVLGLTDSTISSVKTFKQLLFDSLKNTRVSFTGEPLAPIQIMGLIETRTLDFDTIIVLSCNEGILPKGKLLNSVIPFDIRREFRLPTHQESDATFAYNFYRLFHRAKNVYLIYTDTIDSTIGAKEKSRFLTQIEAEWGHLENIKFFHQKVHFALPEKMEKSTIRKTSRIKEKLRAYLEANILKTRLNPITQEEEIRTEGGLTPSYINKFLANPKEFARKKILDIKDADEIEEWLEVNTFGNLIHGYLEEIMLEQDLLNKPLTDKDIEKILKENQALQEHLDKLLANHAGQVVSKRGKNYLLKRIAGLLLEKYVKMQLSEKEKVDIILAVEQELKTTIPVLVNDQEILVVLKGNADRIDVQNDIVRVVDYKTGKHDSKALKAKNLDELLQDTSKEKVIQLMIYRYLLLKELNNPDSELRKNLPEKLKEKIAKNGGLKKEDIQAGFIFFRSLGTNGFVEYSLELEKVPNFPKPPNTKTKQQEKQPRQAGEDVNEELSRLNSSPTNDFNLEQFVEEFIKTVVTKMFEGEEFSEETPFGDDEEDGESID